MSLGVRGPKWDYDKSEILVDGIVHGSGIVLGVIAVAILIALAVENVGVWELASILVYGGALLAMLVVSALYNLWPISPRKWALRRLDHSAIFVLIAGTYTPFISQVWAGLSSLILLVGLWTTSLVGIGFKLRFPDRFDGLTTALYILSGWSGLAVYEAFTGLPHSTILLLVAGGLLYTAGVMFHVWRSLRFQNAIWHAFVLAAAVCHYGAVLEGVVLANA